MSDGKFKTIASANSASTPQGRVLNQARFNNAGRNTLQFDQTFDRDTTQPLNRSSSQIMLSKELGGNLTKNPSQEKMSIHKPIKEESYHKTMPLRNNQSQSKLNNDVATSSKLEDSIAAVDRPPRRVEGLTAFLRKEYFRIHGIYIKGSRGESEKLKLFWKDNVSETYKKLREKQAALAKAKDPYAQSVTFGPSAAVPTAVIKTQIEKEYEQYKNCFELDVYMTVERDLEEEARDEKIREVQTQSGYETQQRQSMIQQDMEKINLMLQLFYFGPPVVTMEDKKVDGVVVRDHYGKPIKEKVSKTDITGPKAQTYQFMSQLLRLVRENNLLNAPHDVQVIKSCYLDNRSRFQWPKDDREATQILSDFFTDASFTKRLQLHKDHINKSKTKQQSILTLYFIELSEKSKISYLLAQKDAYKVLQEHIKNGDKKQQEEQRQAQLQKRIDKAKKEGKTEAEIKLIVDDEKIRYELKIAIAENNHDEVARLKLEFKKLHPKKQPDLDRVERLAKPKDKWKLGKQLLKLQREFPHDRVLERMIREEFATNQAFRYPAEYDTFRLQQDQKLKILGDGEKGLKVRNDDFGVTKLGEFKENDKVLRGMEQRTKQAAAKAKRAFELDVVKEASNYILSASNRLKHQMANVQEDSHEKKLRETQGNVAPTQDQNSKRQTMRIALAEIYNRLLTTHGPYVKTNFRMLTYGMTEGSETMKKAYPDTFARYFFRWVKCISDKKGTGLSLAQLKKRFRKLPAAFIISAGKQRCTMHEFSCPTEDCPFVTNNKKIIMTQKIAQHPKEELVTHRQRVFYRQDLKKKLNDIFMTRDEQINCTFEPATASLKAHSKTMNAEIKKIIHAEADHTSYITKLGRNFDKSHPEVFKAGKLKKAKMEAKSGNYEKALIILGEGFNIDSLNRRFNANYLKQKMVQEMMQKQRAEREASQGRKTAIESISHMKETVVDNQKGMAAEDFENQKLFTILQEAYELLAELTQRKEEAAKKVKQIEKAKKEMQQTKKNFNESKGVQEDDSKTAVLFKTIMCPLGDNCPKVRKSRWPNSSIKSVTNFGAMCPYAHHLMELEFPETLKTKISAATQQKKKVIDSLAEKKGAMPFRPASGKIWSFPSTELSQGERDKIAKFNKTLKAQEDPEMRAYFDEMKGIQKKLNIDDNYCKKFGLLKKASVLLFYGRENEAFNEIAKAVQIIKEQKQHDAAMYEAIQRRWRFKLGLDEGFELPFPIDKVHPDDIDYKKLEADMGTSVPLATIKMFVEQVSPFRVQEGSKDQYLNNCIQDLYIECEAKIQAKMDTIAKMKENVTKLEELAEMADMFADGEEGQPAEMFGDDGKPIKVKAVKTKMCKKLLENGKCNGIKDKSCKFAHNAIELSLIPVSDKIKNLNTVMAAQKQKLVNNKVTESWVSAGKQSLIQDASIFAKFRETTEYKEEDEKEEDKPKSIFERENIFRKPFEEKD